MSVVEQQFLNSFLINFCQNIHYESYKVSDVFYFWSDQTSFTAVTSNFLGKMHCQYFTLYTLYGHHSFTHLIHCNRMYLGRMICYDSEWAELQHLFNQQILLYFHCLHSNRIHLYSPVVFLL